MYKPHRKLLPPLETAQNPESLIDNVWKFCSPRDRVPYIQQVPNRTKASSETMGEHETSTLHHHIIFSP